MKSPTLSTLLIVLTILLWGCSDSDDVLQTSGRLNVFLVDAPFPTEDVAEANVDIFKVEARLKISDNEDATEMESESESEDPENGFITLSEETFDNINLLELINGASEQIAGLDVPAGTYDLVRVYVRGVNVVLNDGTEFNLNVPSGAQSGIKVFLNPPLNIVGGVSEDLILDFDVSKSFKPKGNMNTPDGITGFNFTPVIKGSNRSTSGTISGTVTTVLEDETIQPLENVQVEILRADNTVVTTTQTDQDGGYSAPGLLPGIYTVEAILTNYETGSIPGVEVFAGNKTEQNLELTSETPEE